MKLITSSPKLRAYFFLLKSFLGLGCLAFPFAFSIVGTTPAFFLTIVIVLLIRYSMHQLIYVDDLMIRKRVGGGTSASSSKRTFPTIALQAFESVSGLSGKFLESFTLATLVFGQIGTCTSYLMFLSSNAQSLASRLTSTELTHSFSVFLVLPLLTPLILVRDIRTLHPASVAGMVAFALGVACLFSVQCNNSKETNWVDSSRNLHLFKPEGLFRFIGIALFAAEGITALPSAKSALDEEDEEENETKVVNVSSDGQSAQGGRALDIVQILDSALLTMTIILISFGFFGWHCFGKNPPSIVTEVLVHDRGFFSLAARVFLTFYILFTFPLQLYPVSQALEAIIFSPTNSKNRERRNSGESVAMIPSIIVDASGSGGTITPRKLSPARRAPSASIVHEESRLLSRQGLRIALLILTAMIASSVSSFAGVLAVCGWLTFGVLTFLLPPLMYAIQVTTHYTRDQLSRGLHLSDWQRRVSGKVSSDGNVLFNAVSTDEQLSYFYSWNLEQVLLSLYSVGGTFVSIFGCIGALYEVGQDQSHN
jgi:amino acid permease